MALATFTLKNAITVRGETTNGLALMRRANLGDIRASAKGIDEWDTLQIMVSRLCEITQKEADQIDATELAAVNEWLAPFVQDFRTTGEADPS